MIHLKFEMTRKKYRNICVQALGFYYIRLYFITLFLGTLIIGAIAAITGNQTMTRASYSMYLTFFPVLLICAVIAGLLSLFEVRRVYKNHPEVTQGQFKVRFEKNFMIVQINGKNNKLHYTPYRLFKILNHGFLLYRPQHGHIAIPGGQVTKEQIKQIKSFIRESVPD